MATVLSNESVFGNQQELADQADRNALLITAISSAVSAIGTVVNSIQLQGVKIDTDTMNELIDEMKRAVGKKTIRG